MNVTLPSPSDTSLIPRPLHRLLPRLVLPTYEAEDIFAVFIQFLDQQGCKFTRSMLAKELQHMRVNVADSGSTDNVSVLRIHDQIEEPGRARSGKAHTTMMHVMISTAIPTITACTTCMLLIPLQHVCPTCGCRTPLDLTESRLSPASRAVSHLTLHWCPDDCHTTQYS